ncbi:putative transcriptional regulator, MerR family [Alkaliphilus metalliredigens QYMF]|uniref:Putative transcriptional regulator, MerR family n=1 Tax=Alkaliphilus metalliredigens (strain QYMF) TaxID=293826 RepID=A6TK38_ALKMQ|nr:MerR family transcriptional regulator [Alkaliphilus metalliredigens]ABR46556.1 putative transcriptional regulator, MerR family [Alkaliphilus metalliredigens QYMF]
MNGMKHSVGNVANILGLSPGILRHYEKLGIINPERDNSGYRSYSTRDVNILMGVRKLIGMGFSLEEVKHLIYGASLEKVKQSLDTLEENMKKEIRWRQLVLEFIQKQRQEYEVISEESHKFEITKSPAVYRIRSQYENFLSAEEAANTYVYRWISKMPIVRISPEFSVEAIYNQTEEYQFGFVVEEELAEELELMETPDMIFIPSQLCLTTIISSQGEDHIKASMLKRAVNYIAKHNMKISDNAWGMTIGSYVEKDMHKRFHKIFIPIENENK